MARPGFGRTILAAAVMLGIGSSGCVELDEGNTVTIRISGEATSLGQTKNLPGCGDSAELSYNVAQVGSKLKVLVQDGDGAVVFVRDFTDEEYSKGGSAETGSLQHALFGASGEWHLVVEWEGHNEASFALRCRANG